jgi:RNA polymerase sigma-70 factor (ECF subfamily)
MAFSVDKQILESASQGDRAALTTLVRTLTPYIEKQLLRYPLSDEDRRDLVQSTLMQILRRVGSFRGDSSFSTWLFRVTANEALMMMRSQRRHRARLVDYRDVVSLHYHQDLGLQEIASRLATTESAVRSRLHRARARLRAILEKSSVGGELSAA